jgi:hypothetical protein
MLDMLMVTAVAETERINLEEQFHEMAVVDNYNRPKPIATN